MVPQKLCLKHHALYMELKLFYYPPPNNSFILCCLYEL